MNLKTQCTVYQNAEQYEKEFIENVESCKNEMKESFGEYNNNNVIVSVKEDKRLNLFETTDL